MKRAMMLGLGLGLAACTDDPVAPLRQPARITISDEELAAVRLVLDDAQNRVRPALADHTVANAVSEALASAAGSLEARNQDDFRLAFGRARTALTQGAAEGDAPMVETLRLIIAVTEAAVLGGETPHATDGESRLPRDAGGESGRGGTVRPPHR